MSKLKIDWSQYTPFQQRVLKEISKIPAGKVLTYAQVAQRLGNKYLARAVGNALAKNMHAPAIPCHRVIASSGKLGGYSAPGGLKKKIKLLRTEGYRI
ncbi:MAG TPA: MGMT family protein [Candidatus Binatia bacterium]|nr:MGMT family protein [Candidatus Binatia bacterium]